MSVPRKKKKTIKKKNMDTKNRHFKVDTINTQDPDTSGSRPGIRRKKNVVHSSYIPFLYFFLLFMLCVYRRPYAI